MDNQFEIVGGSVLGWEHRRIGRNNQDAYHWLVTKDAIVALVCDGCGSGVHSEVGAKVGAQLVAQAFLAVLKRMNPATDVDFWVQVRQVALLQIHDWISAMGGDYLHILRDYFLFTSVGALITPAQTWIFSIGDGAIALNGELTPLGPFPDNAPPYLAYGLIQDYVEGLTPEDLRFQVHHQVATAEVQSILLGTDGVLDLVALEDLPLPGKDELVGPLAQFWQANRYFKNPLRVSRQLAMINHEAVQMDWDTMTLNRRGGLLPDDTTLIVIRRKS